MSFVNISSIEKDFNFIDFYLQRLIENAAETKKANALRALTAQCKPKTGTEFIQCSAAIDVQYQKVRAGLADVDDRVSAAKERLELGKLRCVEHNLSESDIKGCFKGAKREYVDALKHVYVGIR